MPDYRINETILEVVSNALLIDTNVLVAAFSPKEDSGRREYAQFILNDAGLPLLVPSVVVVEAWGLIVGSHRAWPAGIDLLRWLSNPGAVTIVPPHRAELHRTRQLIDGLCIDCVDAMIAELAVDIAMNCNLSDSPRIATFDASDYQKISQKHGLRLHILDMRSLDCYSTC